MLLDGKIWAAIDKDSGEKICIFPKMANRHGLIAGATGTGKTVTLKVLAESFSKLGVPVFLSDVKGDLAGIMREGEESEDMRKRIERYGLSGSGFRYQSFPVTFWDIEGKKGLPLRTTITEVGPTLLSRLLGLSQLQSDILSIVFRIADEENLLLIDTKDLRSMLSYIGDNSQEYSQKYGNMTKQSLNAILRAVVALETVGGDRFFGEPAIDIHDFLKTDNEGRGRINILDSQETINNPKIYSTFMLYMLSELFEQLPEVGDLEKPKLVFFFDEAHLLFDGAPKVLLEKIEQVVRLIRSKGVGVFFVTQNPSDIPDTVLAQLGNRIQHALRSYTPAEKKKIRTAAQSYRENPAFKTETEIEALGTGEALISFLDHEGKPEIVHRAYILPPESRLGTINDNERAVLIANDPLYKKYDEAIDRDSAYEFIMRHLENLAEEERKAREEEEEIKLKEREEREAIKEKEREEERARRRKSTAIRSVGRSTAGTIGREVGYTVGKSMLGNSVGRRIGGNIGAALGRGILDTIFGR